MSKDQVKGSWCCKRSSGISQSSDVIWIFTLSRMLANMITSLPTLSLYDSVNTLYEYSLQQMLQDDSCWLLDPMLLMGR